MEKSQRRSLLPQRSAGHHWISQSDVQVSQSSGKISAPYTRNVTNPVGSVMPLSITEIEADNASSPPKPDPPNPAKQHPNGNVERTLSFRKPVGREASTRSGAHNGATRQNPASKSNLTNSKLSSARHSRANSTEHYDVSPRRPKQPSVDAPNGLDQDSGMKQGQPGAKAHAEVSLPNIAVSRHVKALSHQLPASRDSNPLLAAPKEAPSNSGHSKRLKPGFSTMQQHFTPRKAPKALTSSFLVQPSNKQLEIEKASAEIASQQMELLRLHLLHCSSGLVQKSWEESAQQHLRLKFYEVQKQRERVKKLHSSIMTRKNYPSLRKWSQEVSNVELGERLQIFSRSLLEVTNFWSPDSNYSLVLEEFQVWFSNADRVLQLRKGIEVRGDTSIEFIEEIRHGWKADVMGFQRRLTMLSREMHRLGKPQEGSCLAHLLDLLRTAAANMSEELETIRNIESAITVSDAEWLREQANKVVTEVDSQIDKPVAHRKAWAG